MSLKSFDRLPCVLHVSTDKVPFIRRLINGAIHCQHSARLNRKDPQKFLCTQDKSCQEKGELIVWKKKSLKFYGLRNLIVFLLSELSLFSIPCNTPV